jgi:hypothetical protein
MCRAFYDCGVNVKMWPVLFFNISFVVGERMSSSLIDFLKDETTQIMQRGIMFKISQMDGRNRDNS